MHRNEGSDRIAEAAQFNMFGDESCYVGDTQTARAIDRLADLIEERFPVPPAPAKPSAAERLEELDRFVRVEFTAVRLRIDHLGGKHDFTHVEGCPSCEVRRAA